MKMMLVTKMIMIGMMFLTNSRVLSQSFEWKALSVEKLTILNVLARSEQEAFAAAIDHSKGSVLLHSIDQGATWEEIATMGSNLDVSMTKDSSLLCAAGTKVYCFPLPTKEQRWDGKNRLIDQSVKITPKEIHPLGDHGVAIVGMLPSPSRREPLNGVAFNSFISRGQAVWEYSDIGLSVKDGYTVSSASFPSNDTWYVTSGSWPVQNAQAADTLSGRLNIAFGKGDAGFNNYNYELLPLKDAKGSSTMKGAISKTEDGGKTWKKVYDSENQYYFNQIDCFDLHHCITIGEGKDQTVLLLTQDGGDHWEPVLKLDSTHSLHACKMLTKTEFHIGGGMKEGSETLKGLYYHSKDAGQTWQSSTFDGYVFDMSFTEEGKVGYSAVLHKDHCQITQLLQ